MALWAVGVQIPPPTRQLPAEIQRAPEPARPPAPPFPPELPRRGSCPALTRNPRATDSCAWPAASPRVGQHPAASTRGLASRAGIDHHVAQPMGSGRSYGPKSAHWKGLSRAGSMLARQSQLDGVLAGGEPMTIAISSPFVSTIVDGGSWVCWRPRTSLSSCPADSNPLHTRV